MDFSTFDTAEMDRYAAQAKEKWGKTDAYKEFQQKTAGKLPSQIKAAGDALMDIFAEFGKARRLSPASPEAQALVVKLQDFISEHYYTCTKQILRSLGQMYIAGDSMTENIDKAGGQGTAEFVHQTFKPLGHKRTGKFDGSFYLSAVGDGHNTGHHGHGDPRLADLI